MVETVSLAKPVLSEMADEYGELARRIRMYAPDLNRAEELRKQIQALYEHEDPLHEFTIEGELYFLRIGKRAINRIVTIAGMRKIFKYLGQTKFLAECSFPKQKLDDLNLEGIIEEERTGPRKIEAVALNPAKT